MSLILAQLGARFTLTDLPTLAVVFGHPGTCCRPRPDKRRYRLACFSETEAFRNLKTYESDRHSSPLTTEVQAPDRLAA